MAEHIKPRVHKLLTQVSIMHNEAVYVRHNELNPWVRKRNGIKFYVGQLFYLNSSTTCLCAILAQPRTQGFIFAPVALPLRKNPGPGWSRDTFISCNPWGGGGVRPSMRQMVITSAMFYSSLYFAIVNSHLYSSIILKPKQVMKCLEAVYFGRDVIAVLPTGYGKSLIFHLLPSLFYDKLTSASNKRAVVIVVSPLNALIENQIKKSYQGNIKAGILNVKKGKDDEDLRLKLVGTDLLLRDAMYDIIYRHPEAFLSCKEGMELLQSVPYQKSVRAIIVDEAHCILEWYVCRV